MPKHRKKRHLKKKLVGYAKRNFGPKKMKRYGNIGNNIADNIMKMI
jgi:hypothetical protein